MHEGIWRNRPTFALRGPKATHVLLGEHEGILGRLEVRWGKVMCCSTKAAVSLKCVNVEEKLLWRAYRKSQTLFRTVPFPTPTASYSPRLGVRNPTPKLQSLLSGRSHPKLPTDFKFGRCIHISQCPSEQKPIKNFGEKGAWTYPGTAHFLVTP